MAATNRPVLNSLNAMFDLHRQGFYKVMDELVNNTPTLRSTAKDTAKNDERISFMGAEMEVNLSASNLKLKNKLGPYANTNKGVVPVADPREEPKPKPPVPGR